MIQTTLLQEILLENLRYLGVLTKGDYYDKATFLRKGDVDPSNNYTVKADCYNVRIDELAKQL